MEENGSHVPDVEPTTTERQKPACDAKSRSVRRYWRGSLTSVSIAATTPVKSYVVWIPANNKAMYGMSMIENLATISKFGIQEFAKKENERWTCPQCGEIVCVHHPDCGSCGHVWNKKQ
jgi:hypothetical protein